jgi:hypothetical protein
LPPKSAANENAKRRNVVELRLSVGARSRNNGIVKNSQLASGLTTR